jgi:uncharacterized membrane protein YphA (DoxX/SURF4 family)
MENRSMKWWNTYWFRPAPCIDLAMVRIIAVSTQLLLLLFNGTEPFVRLGGLPDAMYNPITTLHLFIWPFGWHYRPSFATIHFIQNVAIVLGFLALIGLMTRITLLLFALCNIFMIAWAYSFNDFHHTQAPLFIALVVLACAPVGQVLSVDAVLRRRRNPTAPSSTLTQYSELAGWPILLIQWLFVLIYLSAVMSKLLFEGGPDWLNGYTLQYYLIQDSLRKGTLLGMWFSQYHTLVLVSQYALVIFQITFVLAVVFARLRWIYVPFGLGFHIGNILLLNASFPQWMALYAVFIPWKQLFELIGERASLWRQSPGPA